MKKSLSILLVLMLVLVPVTAMAKEGVDTETHKFTGNSASTDFKVEVNTSNINVTVPLSVTFVAPVGGGASTFPSAGAYQIINNSSMAVHVSNISAAIADDTATKTTPISFATEAQTGTSTPNNAFYVTIKAGGDTATPLNETEGGFKTITTGTNWNVDAKSSETAGTLEMTLAGSNSPLDITNTAAVKIFTLTFTIAPGALPLT